MAGIPGISGISGSHLDWHARLLALAEPALITRDGHGGIVRAGISMRDT